MRQRFLLVALKIDIWPERSFRPH